jgi:retron-type reverse transcriptase
MNFSRNSFEIQAREDGHSDSFIDNTLGYADNLVQRNLPVIFSIKHFAILTNTDFRKLRQIINNREFHYSYYLIKKRRGGFRRIVAPHKNIKLLQKWIQENILDKLEFDEYVTGFVKNRSILNNAKFHENSQVILNFDLSNFFETITERRVYGLFKSLGYATNLAVDFAKICTVAISEEKYNKLDDEEKEYFNDLLNKEPVLVQGAPTSPGISNLICKNLDKRLSKLAIKSGVNYSRYADDITFSGNSDKLPNVGIIKKIINEENFAINWDKVGKYKTGQRQLVTGLLVDNKVRIPKKFKKDIYRHLHFCKKFGAYSHFQRVCPDKGYRKEWMLGKILYVHSIEPDEAKKMFDLAEQINWEI